MRKEQLPEAMTASELAALLRWHPRTVYRKAREGLIPCVHLGGTSPRKGGRGVRFLASDIAKWLEQHS